MNPRYSFHLLMALCTACLSSCTRLNLVDQLSPPDKRVPIIAESRNPHFTVYELDGNYYLLRTVFMGTEDVPLLTSRFAGWPSMYGKYIVYTPDTSTARDYLFPLTDDEAARALQFIQRLPERPVIKQPAAADKLAVIAAQDFDFDRAHCWHEPYTHYHIRPESVAVTQKHSYYSTPEIPGEPGTRSLGNKLALAPVWLADTAGNLLLSTAETAVLIPAFVTAPIGVGLLYLCGGRLP